MYMNRAIFLVLFSFCGLLTMSSQGMKWTKQYQDYFNRYQDAAIDQMYRYKIPASITLAQGVLESAAGNSELARKGNNHFGIKCNNGWTGRRTYHDDDELGECFRSYDSVSESYEDHSLFLTTGKRYRPLFSLKMTDYKGWARGLKACGYATSPTYASKLIEIIELYKLYLFDTPKGYGHEVSQQPVSQAVVQRVEAPSMRQVYYFNDNYYVLAHGGETYRTLADEVGVGYKKLARYNERNKNDILEENEIVWLQKKQRHAPKEFKNRFHTVGAGESMYTIAQKYGIRLKNLYKINHLSPDYTPRVGDQLWLR